MRIGSVNDLVEFSLASRSCKYNNSGQKYNNNSVYKVSILKAAMNRMQTGVRMLRPLRNTLGPPMYLDDSSRKSLWSLDEESMPTTHFPPLMFPSEELRITQRPFRLQRIL
jgi:hypothetical protein